MKALVAHVSPWGVHCGIAKHLSYWLPHLSVKSIVCAEHPPYWHKAVENWNTVPAFRCWKRGAATDLQLAIAPTLEKHGVRIVHMQWDPSFFPFACLEWYAKWADELGIKTVVTAHTLFDAPLFTWENKAIVRIVDQLVVGTPAMVTAYEVYAARFDMTPRRPVCWVPLATPNFCRRPLPKMQPGPVVLTWGFLGGIKGHMETLEAVRRLRPEMPTIRYVVAGEAMTGEQRNILATLRELEGAEPDLLEVREGFLEEQALADLCRSADIIVLNHQVPQASSSGTVVLSVASGTPVVVSRSPMFSGYTEAGAVKVAEPGVEGMAEAMRDVLTGADDLADGRRAMMRRASAKAVALQYEHIYERLLA